MIVLHITMLTREKIFSQEKFLSSNVLVYVYPREGISQDCKYRHTMKRTKRKSKLSQAVSFLIKNWTKIYITSFGYYLVNVSFDLSINRAATVAKYENLSAKELETVNSKPDFEAWKNSLGQKMRVKLSLREHILNKDSDN